jgi:hypothetical protein
MGLNSALDRKDDGFMMNPIFMKNAKKTKNTELESMITKHLENKKDRRRRSLGKHFHKAASKLHHDTGASKHRRTPSNPAAAKIKTGNFIQNFRSSRTKGGSKPKKREYSTHQNVERSKSNSLIISRKRNAGSNARRTNNGHHQKSSYHLDKGLAREKTSGRKTKQEKIMELRKKFGLGIRKGSLNLPKSMSMDPKNKRSNSMEHNSIVSALKFSLS